MREARKTAMKHQSEAKKHTEKKGELSTTRLYRRLISDRLHSPLLTWSKSQDTGSLEVELEGTKVCAPKVAYCGEKPTTCREKTKMTSMRMTEKSKSPCGEVALRRTLYS